MSDTGYWAGLRSAGVFLYLAYVCLFLAIAIFVFLYDRISVWAFWETPVWLKIKIPCIIVGVIAFLGALLSYIRYEGRKELQAAQEYAQSQGWDFSPDDTLGLKERVSDILFGLKNIDVRHIRTVETGQRSLYLFDCSYKYQYETSRMSYSYGVACMIQSERLRSVSASVEIFSRDWSEVMESDKVDMGRTPFAEKYILLSKDPEKAKVVVNETVQAVILEHLKKPLSNPVSISLGPAGAVVLTGRTAEPERLQDLVDLARRIESAVE